jgi:glycine reductase
VLAKELEKAGIPTAQITAMTPVALGASSIRVVQGKEIVNPLGNAKMDLPTEKKLRLEIIAEALKALQTQVKGSTLFQSNKPKDQ